MKITKEHLRKLIKEEVSLVKTNSFMIPNPAPVASLNQQNLSIDPDGYEGRMAKASLYKIAEYANMLQNLIQDNENLEPWVQEKIAVASSMIDSVGHYLQYEKMRGK